MIDIYDAMMEKFGNEEIDAPMKFKHVPFWLELADFLLEELNAATDEAYEEGFEDGYSEAENELGDDF